jgi:hypothetical protein
MTRHTLSPRDSCKPRGERELDVRAGGGGDEEEGRRSVLIKAAPGRWTETTAIGSARFGSQSSAYARGRGRVRAKGAMRGTRCRSSTSARALDDAGRPHLAAAAPRASSVTALAPSSYPFRLASIVLPPLHPRPHITHYIPSIYFSTTGGVHPSQYEV